MKKQLLTSVLTVAMASAAVPASAEDVGSGFDVSANVGLLSDYLWRGVSQSNNKPAIQGGIDLKHSSGAYVGLWMSSLSGWYNNGGNDFASSEEDFYVGYGMQVTEDISVDVRYTQFMYAGDNDANFDELHAAVSGFGATVGTDYADNRSNGNASTAHYYGSYAYTFSQNIAVSATYGQYDLKDQFAPGTSDYDYYNIGVSKKVAGITWGLSYNDTNLDNNECRGFAGTIANFTQANDACGDQFVFTANKAF